MQNLLSDLAYPRKNAIFMDNKIFLMGDVLRIQSNSDSHQLTMSL